MIDLKDLEKSVSIKMIINDVRTFGEERVLQDLKVGMTNL